ncbi:MAG TPA: hypothetical protein VLB44_21085 [Kofleriaceae bacterium]|nr:hypothetical protein [Kofleriaceae bacterium]
MKWTFDHYPDRNFPMDSCVDFGVSKVAVDVVDSAGGVQSLQDDCGTAQVTFWGLAPGDYTVYVTPLDINGNGLVGTPAAGTVTVGQPGDNHETSVNVTWDQWVGSFTGTFLFRISWGGMSCDALPDIKSQTVTLTVNGIVQNIVTDDGQMMNGSDKKPCKKLTDEFPQSALGASFGMATLLVEGYDATDNMKYSKQFDTFVGAGITNPTLTFDVPLQ